MIHRGIAAATAAIILSSGISYAPASELTGASAPLGLGTVESYATVGVDGIPAEIGVRFSTGALEGLPQARNNTSRCFDLDGNGAINASGECDGDYENNLPFPAKLMAGGDIPFDFAMVNWNPEGHPPEPWLPPHFDIHFYQIPLSAVDAMKVGRCGIFMDCDAFEIAIRPVPANYVHPEYVSVDAAVGRMGNHLIDTLTPEFGNPPQPFTHTWIFGAYDGSVIFHEVMATLSFMVLGSNTCTPIKQPQAWEEAGYYPTRYCFRHGSDGGLEVFMEGFELRPAG